MTSVLFVYALAFGMNTVRLIKYAIKTHSHKLKGGVYTVCVCIVHVELFQHRYAKSYTETYKQNVSQTEKASTISGQTMEIFAIHFSLRLWIIFG